MNARRRRFAKQRRRFERRVERWEDRWRELVRRIQDAKARALAHARDDGMLPLDLFQAGMTQGEALRKVLRAWEREGPTLRAAVAHRRLARVMGWTR